jgi:AraC family transcriptional regulator
MNDERSIQKPETVDLKGEYIEHIHLLSTFEWGWNGLNLVYEIEPAGEMPESKLDRHALIISQGDFQANYAIDGKWRKEEYSKGDVVLLPADGIFPKVQVDRDVPLIQLYLEPTMFDRALGKSRKVDIVPNFKFRDPLIEQMGIALKTELEAGGIDSKLYAESMAIALSAHLLRKYASRSPEFKPCTGGLSPSQLKQASEYIQENLDRDLSLEELANILHISSHYFVHLFKRSTGFSPHQYIIKCRIEKAKKLLQQRELSIIEICQKVGFQSQSHFTRLFRKHTQTTPKVYRDYF